MLIPFILVVFFMKMIIRCVDDRFYGSCWCCFISFCLVPYGVILGVALTPVAMALGLIGSIFIGMYIGMKSCCRGSRVRDEIDEIP